MSVPAADLTGQVIVVTGANSGIGLETARALVGRGAHVVLAVRDTDKGETAAASLAGTGSTSVVELDLADLDHVERCAKELLERHDHLSALVCNAGVMGGPLQLTPQGFERQMATNHLGHAALVAALWPLLHASAARCWLSPLSAAATRPSAQRPMPARPRGPVSRSTWAAPPAPELHRLWKPDSCAGTWRGRGFFGPRADNRSCRS